MLRPEPYHRGLAGVQFRLGLIPAALGLVLLLLRVQRRLGTGAACLEDAAILFAERAVQLREVSDVSLLDRPFHRQVLARPAGRLATVHADLELLRLVDHGHGVQLRANLRRLSFQAFGAQFRRFHPPGGTRNPLVGGFLCRHLGLLERFKFSLFGGLHLVDVGLPRLNGLLVRDHILQNRLQPFDLPLEAILLGVEVRFQAGQHLLAPFDHLADDVIQLLRLSIQSCDCIQIRVLFAQLHLLLHANLLGGS
mmetsp:Transcript_4181/g.8045  ORF Transcript_4181/g.8045 Transcript_4181/m.8045 type:complete len:252 (+) Transcript_4181:676-1431(+)